jgi:hypothetical protein
LQPSAFIILNFEIFTLLNASDGGPPAKDSTAATIRNRFA